MCTSKMEPETHLFVSAALASAVYFFTTSIPAAVAAFAGGFLLDLDHFFDFMIFKKRLVLDSQFFTLYFRKTGYLFILLHSYEMVLALWVLAFLTDSILVLGFAVGVTLHMLMDVVGNHLDKRVYSLIFRLANGFRIRI